MPAGNPETGMLMVLLVVFAAYINFPATLYNPICRQELFGKSTLILSLAAFIRNLPLDRTIG